MPFNDGDIVLVEYSLFVKETNELVDTTNESVAKLHGKYSEEEVYEPEVVVVGEGRFIPGVEEAIRNAEVGKEYEVEIPPEKGYGERDPSKVKVFSRRIFVKNNIIPEIGKEVKINNMTGRIITVGGGRVTVDFNHPLAGKTLLFKFKVLKKIEDLIEKVKYLIKRRAKRVQLDEIKVEHDLQEGKVTVELPREMRLADGVQLLKFLTARDITKWVPEIKVVVFVEKYSKEDFGGGANSEQGEQEKTA